MMRIELYINSEEYAAKGGTGLYMRYHRGQETSHDEQLRTRQRIVELPEEIVNLRNLLERIASQHNLDIIVYDRTRLRDTVRAFFKGIHRTPTVRIGKHKFTGNITEGQINKAIKSG